MRPRTRSTLDSGLNQEFSVASPQAPATTFTSPQSLQKLRNFSLIPPAYQKWRDVLCSSLKADTRHSFFEGDGADAGFPFTVGIIIQICQHQVRLQLPNRANLDSETDLLLGVDSLIMHSCNGDGDELLVHSTEQKLRLPASNSSRVSDKVNVITTTAGGVTSLDVINFDPYMRRPKYQELMSAFSAKSPTPHLILVHCVVKYERNGKSEKQMKLVMVSALYQKKDGLQVVVGIWEDDTIKLYQVENYSLRHPVSFVELYLFLRGMKHLAADYKELMKSSKALLRIFGTNQWATRNTGTIPEVEEPNDHPQHGGGQNFNEHYRPLSNGIWPTG